MLTSILGARLSWYQANGWVFEPVVFGPDIVDYHLKEGPHAGRHAIQHFYYQRVAPGIETTVWYEESGALVHITWYLETQTTHRFAALPAWLGSVQIRSPRLFLEMSPPARTSKGFPISG